MRALLVLSCIALCGCGGSKVVDIADAGDGGGSAAGGGAGGGGAQGGGAPGGGGAVGGGGGGSAVDAGLTPEQLALLQARPYNMTVPDSYDGGTAAVPFVMLLHGYTATGTEQDVYFRLSQLAQDRGFLLATPDGLVDSLGQHFWNATDACCDLDHTHVDDVAYLTAVIDDVKLKYRVDPKRVFLMGHSNGAFMAHRLACDRSSRIAGIMALAGDNWKDGSRCQPSEPVAVLQVHGTLDMVIAYNGGSTAGQGQYPGAVECMEGWAARLGCSASSTSAGPNLDVDVSLLGDETVRTQWAGCGGGAAELWTIQGGTHLPVFGSAWPGNVYDWLLTHPKP